MAILMKTKKAPRRYRLNGNGRLSPSFFLFCDGGEDGPFTRRELEEMHRSGKVSAAVPCRLQDEREWRDLGFLLRTSSPESDTAPADVPELASENPISRNESVRTLVTTLVENVERQNQLLRAIKWSLLALAVILASGLAVYFTGG